MPSIINLPGIRLYRFGLGEPPEQDREIEPHLRWVLDDYGARRDEQWRVPQQSAGVVLTKLYYEEKAQGSTSKLPAILSAFGFYGGLVAYARHFAWEDIVSKDTFLARTAASVLGSFTKEDSIPVLTPHLNSADDGLRRMSYLSLAKLARPVDLPLLEAGAQADPALLPILEVARARLAAAQAQDALAFLRATLSHEAFYEDITGLAAFLLDDLTALFVSEGALDPASRARCIRVLGLARRGGVVRAEAALTLAQDVSRERELRVQCIVYLGRVQAQVHEELCALLDDPDVAIVEAAVTALGEVGHTSAVGPLLNHYDARGGQLRPAIELAIYRMAAPIDDATYEAWARGEVLLDPHSAYFFHQGFSTTIPEALYIQYLQHQDFMVRREAALLLGLLGSARAARPLRDLAVREADQLTHSVAARAAALANARRTTP